MKVLVISAISIFLLLTILFIPHQLKLAVEGFKDFFSSAVPEKVKPYEVSKISLLGCDGLIDYFNDKSPINQTNSGLIEAYELYISEKSECNVDRLTNKIKLDVGVAYYNLNNPDKAIELLRRLLGNEAEYHLARAYLVYDLIHIGDVGKPFYYKSALGIFEKLKEIEFKYKGESLFYYGEMQVRYNEIPSGVYTTEKYYSSKEPVESDFDNNPLGEPIKVKRYESMKKYSLDAMRLYISEDYAKYTRLNLQKAKDYIALFEKIKSGLTQPISENNKIDSIEVDEEIGELTETEFTDSEAAINAPYSLGKEFYARANDESLFSLEPINGDYKNAIINFNKRADYFSKSIEQYKLALNEANQTLSSDNLQLEIESALAQAYLEWGQLYSQTQVNFLNNLTRSNELYRMYLYDKMENSLVVNSEAFRTILEAYQKMAPIVIYEEVRSQLYDPPLNDMGFHERSLIEKINSFIESMPEAYQNSKSEGQEIQFNYRYDLLLLRNKLILSNRDKMLGVSYSTEKIKSLQSQINSLGQKLGGCNNWFENGWLDTKIEIDSCEIDFYDLDSGCCWIDGISDKCVKQEGDCQS